MKTAGVQMMLDGIETALSHHKPEMARAQAIAEVLAADGSLITADDVRQKFEEFYERPLKVGNAIGSLFSNKKKWEWAGFVHSKRPQSHHRMIRTWRRRQAEQPRDPNPPIVCFENGERFCPKCLQTSEACTCQP